MHPATQFAGSSSSDSNHSTPTYSLLSVEPIQIQGTGSLTLFGLNNRFTTDLPSRLVTRIAPEEYKYTIKMINGKLKKNFVNNVTWFLFGSGCMCCTLGISLCPAVYFNKRTIRSVNKVLKSENCRLYNKLGLHWSVQKQCFNANVVEYVLQINFVQKPDIYVPD